MLRKRWLILTTLACLLLIGLVPLGMQAWAISVVKQEARLNTLGIAWNADRYGTWLVKASVVKDARWHPVIITLFDEPHDADKLARAIPWMPHLYSIRMLGGPSSAAVLCDAATRLPGLKVLEVSEARLDSATVARLSKMEQLLALHICLTPDTAMSLPAWPELRQLKLVSPGPLKPVHIEKMLASPQLLNLLLNDAPVTLSDLEAVDWKHASLVRVEFSEELRATDAEIQALVQKMKSQAPRLELVCVGAQRRFTPVP